MFKNLVTLVTGGASGLGRATANRFVQKGAKVIFCDLPTSNGAEVAKELGENAHFIPADVTSETDIKNVVDEISNKYKKLNIIVNCAGIADLKEAYDFGANQPAPLEDFRKVLITNVMGTFNVIRLAVGLIGENEPDENGLRGVVINTSGALAFQGSVGQSTNSAAAGAIHSMTKPLSVDLADNGIRVVTIAPGLMNTPINNSIPPETAELIAEGYIILPKRFGEPDEFAHVVQTIVQNPYINSTTIEVSGGLQFGF